MPDFLVTMSLGAREQSFVVTGVDEVAVRELLKEHAVRGDRQHYRSARFVGGRVDVVWRTMTFPGPESVTPIPCS